MREKSRAFVLAQNKSAVGGHFVRQALLHQKVQCVIDRHGRHARLAGLYVGEQVIRLGRAAPADQQQEALACVRALASLG